MTQAAIGRLPDLNNRRYIKIGLLSFLVCVTSAEALSASKELWPPPNVVLILADDIGVETVGAYGSEYVTPSIDSIASSGIRFDNAHATPVCTPTRTRMMTGTYNFKHYKAFAHLDPRTYTVSELMKDAGYKTMIAGKWQLAGNGVDGLRGTLPAEAGFEESIVWYIEPNKKGKRYWGPTFVKNGETISYCHSDFGPDILNDHVLDFIDRNKSEPFFIYYPMILAHDPWVTTPDSPDADTIPEKFTGMMGYMDKLVGKVLNKLDQHGLAENTLVLFIGDNGTHTDITSQRNGIPVKGGKWFTKDSGTHVPFLARWGTRLPKGEVRDGLVDIMDVTPTLASAVGRPLPVAVDGKELLSMMDGRTTEVRDGIFMHYAPRWGSPHGPMMHARFAFDKHWKLYDDGLFFNTQQDVDEAHPLTIETLKGEALMAYQKLSQLMNSMDDGPLSEPFQNPKIIQAKLPAPIACRE